MHEPYSSPTAVLSPENGAEERQEMSRSTHGSKVMIVDDEPINIKVVRKYLEMEGYRNFVSTIDAPHAFEMIRKEKPDVVLLDIMMPEVSGLDILEMLSGNNETARIPVIILTATGDPETKRKALDLGATDLLAKPVDINELVPRIRNALLVKAHHDHLRDYAEQLERDVRVRTEEVMTTRLQVIHCLARAAEYRDNDTGYHVVRVGRLVGMIARSLGLDEATVELMEHAAPLHDVGKIGIPDSILLKPGKLTPEEFAVIQTHCGLGKRVFECVGGEEWEIAKHHTDIGAKIMSGISSPLMTMAARIATTHHERWDGTGYPLALAGEAIPIEGRITSVADVFDALSSRRPYKPAFPMEKCLAIMEEERGKHFDPAVLDAFLSCIEDIVAIQIKYADTECPR
jgi:cyclic di-GMP phosphodiesterase